MDNEHLIIFYVFLDTSFFLDVNHSLFLVSGE